MGDQEGCTCEVSQQALDGHGHKMVESVEQQTARALADGSPAHQTTAPAAAAAGLLHRLTKPWAVWCTRDAAQGEATRVIQRSWRPRAGRAIWRAHVEELYCKRRTDRGRPHTMRTCPCCPGWKLTDLLASMQW